MLLHYDLQLTDRMVIGFLKGQPSESHGYGSMYSLFEESENLYYIRFEDKTATTIDLFGHHNLLILLSQCMDVSKFSHGYRGRNKTHLPLLFTLSKGLPNSSYQFWINYIEDLALWIVEGVDDFMGGQSFERIG